MADPIHISASPPPQQSECECTTEAEGVQTEKREPGATGRQETRSRMEGQAGSAREKVAEAGERAQQAVQQSAATAQEVAERAKQQFAELAEKAGTQGRDFLNERKNRVAQELHAYSDAARRAASRLEDESDTHLAHYLQEAANRVESFGTHLRERNLGELVDEVEQMARRRPEVFFGAMFVVGLAAARFVKASKRRRTGERAPFAPPQPAPRESTYYDTQPVGAPAPVYPQPATVGMTTGGGASAVSPAPLHL